MRKFVMLLATSLAMLVVFAGSAVAQQYPPTPAGPGQVVTTPGDPRAGAGGGQDLAVTGSNTVLLLWLGLAALIAGTVLVVAARRRAGIRTRGVTATIA